MRIVAKSKAVLQLEAGCQKGLTLRVKESLIYRVKLISDNADLIQCDFYHPNNIFILGRDDITKIKDFIDSPYVDVESKAKNALFFDQMIPQFLGEDIVD